MPHQPMTDEQIAAEIEAQAAQQLTAIEWLSALSQWARTAHTADPAEIELAVKLTAEAIAVLTPGVSTD